MLPLIAPTTAPPPRRPQQLPRDARTRGAKDGEAWSGYYLGHREVRSSTSNFEV
jgi:hypothetical protein